MFYGDFRNFRSAETGAAFDCRSWHWIFAFSVISTGHPTVRGLALRA